MKKNSRNFRISVTTFVIIMFLPVISAQEKIGKEIRGSYEIKEGTNLTLENKYGNIDLRNWEKNSVDVTVQIKLFDVSEQKAQEILKMINIVQLTEGNNIIYRTEFDEDFGKSLMNNNGDKKFEINYIVNMPQTLPVNVTNKYGNVFIDKLSATSTITVKYGKLKANSIASSSNDNLTQIYLAYSDGNIELCSWLKTEIKYSKLEINESKALVIVSKYSKLFLERGSSLVAQAKYDEYQIGTVANFVVQADYCNFRFKSIGKKLNSETSYSDVKIAYMPPSFESVNITNRYGAYHIAIEDGASYNLKGISKYGDISYPKTGKVSRFQETTELNVDGYVGSNANSKSKVTIDTKYGSVNLQE